MVLVTDVVCKAVHADRVSGADKAILPVCLSAAGTGVFFKSFLGCGGLLNYAPGAEAVPQAGNLNIVKSFAAVAVGIKFIGTL